jgi:gluconolactonase
MDVRHGGADLIARRKFLQAGLAAGAALVAPTVRAQELPLGLLPGTRFPDPRIEVLDRRFNKYKIENAGIQRVATGFGWCEGPVYFRDGGYLVFSDIPNNRIMQWSENDGHVGVFRYRSNYANGNTRDHL